MEVNSILPYTNQMTSASTYLQTEEHNSHRVTQGINIRSNTNLVDCDLVDEEAAMLSRIFQKFWESLYSIVVFLRFVW